MTILEASRASTAIRNLMQLNNLSGKEILALVRLSEKLKVAEEVLNNRQDAIITQYADKNIDGNPIVSDTGMVKVSDPQREIAAKKELDALFQTEYDWKLDEKIALTLPEGKLPISAANLQYLMPFIEFEVN